MNIIKTITKSIELRLLETKNPCKSYKTEELAERYTAKMAKEVSEHHGCDRSARYVVFYVESMKAYVGAIDLTELLGRKDCNGGYLALCASSGFYTY